FGMLERDDRGDRLLGSVRCVGRQRTATADELESALPADTSRGALLRSTRESEFPMLAYLVDSPAVRDLLAQIDAAGEAVVEVSRLVLLSAYRASGEGGTCATVKHMVEALVAYFFWLGTQNALLTCSPHHIAFYLPLGFRLAEGTSTRFTPKFGTK